MQPCFESLGVVKLAGCVAAAILTGVLLDAGVEDEIGHNPKYVFEVSSRFNADDSVKGWKEAADIVSRNMAANRPHLEPER